MTFEGMSVKSLFAQQIEKLKWYDISFFLKSPRGIWLKTQFSIRNPSFLYSTFNPILTMPVKTDTFENSTELKISILSENNFCMLLRRLESKAVLKEKKRELFKEMNLLNIQEKQRTKEKK